MKEIYSLGKVIARYNLPGCFGDLENSLSFWEGKGG